MKGFNTPLQHILAVFNVNILLMAFSIDLLSKLYSIIYDDMDIPERELGWVFNVFIKFVYMLCRPNLEGDGIISKCLLKELSSNNDGPNIKKILCLVKTF